MRLKIFRLTLVGRLALAIACLTLLPASLMTAHLYHKERNAAIDKEMRRIHNYSREVAVEIDSFIISQKSIARYAVTDGELRDFLKHDDSATVTKFNRWLESWYDISQNISTGITWMNILCRKYNAPSATTADCPSLCAISTTSSGSMTPGDIRQGTAS
jgi:hypothetical protein